MARSLLRASSGSQKALSMMYLTAAERFDGVKGMQCGPLAIRVST